jgi:actin-like ATPase involved in cell morphogenesis
MSYRLGIDVGTTFITAAVCREEREETRQRAQLEVVPLGIRSAAVRSVVYLGPDGEVVVGEAAERCAGADPDRVVRAFTRRSAGEVSVGVTARVVRWVHDRVAQRVGVPAQGIILTRPTGWDAGEIRAMADALGAAGLPEIGFCSGPEAAAANYSVRERMDVGSTIAVYDLGGGTFEAAVIRMTDAGTFATLGTPERIERLGGIDFDEAVFGHVLAVLPALRESQPQACATARLARSFALCRRECTEAKEALSVEAEVTIPVLLPQVQSQVRLTRAEFEDLIRPQVAHTVEALRRTLGSAGVGPADLDAVLLVGGSSRVPLVAQLLSAELGRPVALDADPQVALALGAALSGRPSAPVASVPTPTPRVPDPAQTELPPWLTATPPEAEPAEVQWQQTSSRRLPYFAAAAFLGLVLAGGAASVPFILNAHRGPTPVPPAIPAPPAPAPVVPAPAVPEPDAGSGAIPSSAHPDSTAANLTTPAEPARPEGSTATSRAATAPAPQRASRSASRPQPPAPAPPPPPPRHLPDWVETARN